MAYIHEIKKYNVKTQGVEKTHSKFALELDSYQGKRLQLKIGHMQSFP